MIAYPAKFQDLCAAAELAKAGWLARAAAVTETYRQQQDYTPNALSWSDIKSVFTTLQHGKCAYCERGLADPELGAKEHEIEHYRPKSSIKVWPSEAMRREADSPYGKAPYTKLVSGDAADKGYYLLAYNLRNYAVACTACNSSLKSNYFPVADKRVLATDDYAQLANEKPYLLFPVGDVDGHKPEDLITFEGILPIPKFKTGWRNLRARVTIDFFKLAIREDLLVQRARILLNIWLAHRTLKTSADEADRADAEEILRLAQLAGFPHSNCTRTFLRLCQTDETRAGQYKEAAKQFLKSRNGLNP